MDDDTHGRAIAIIRSAIEGEEARLRSYRKASDPAVVIRERSDAVARYQRSIEALEKAKKAEDDALHALLTAINENARLRGADIPVSEKAITELRATLALLEQSYDN